MELRNILFFKRVAETEHLTRAANDLFISQSHLSHCIIELENELGVRLFDRVGRGISLNPCGREFYRDVVRMLYEFDDSKNKLVEMQRRLSTQLTLVTNVSTYMPGLLKANKQNSPELNIQQYSAKRRKIIRMLLDGDADYAICCPILTEEPELESVLLHLEPGVVIYPPGHWLKDRKSVTFADIKNEQFISVGVGYGIRDSADEYFKKAGYLPNNSVETTDTSSIYSFVQSGLGIALAPKSMTLRHPTGALNYVPFDEGDQVPLATVGLTWRKNHYRSGAGAAFENTTTAFFGSLEENALSFAQSQMK